MKLSFRTSWAENLIFIFVFLVFFVFFIRLYYLQIKKGDYYRALLEGLYNRFFIVSDNRGKIYLKNDEVVATNKDVVSLVFFLKKEGVLEKELSRISEILELSKEGLLDKIKDNKFFVIKEELTNEEQEKIKKEKFDNFQLISEKRRFYPKGKFLSHLIGFQNKEGKGQYGLEEYYDRELREGKDLVLTIEPEIQDFCEKIVEDYKGELGYEKAEILVVLAKTGEILSFVNFPNFDPNFFYQVLPENFSVFLNFSTQELFEPGSILKPIVMASALEENLISPLETYEDTGEVRIGKWVIKNYDNRVYGRQTMTNVLEKSINTGAIYVQRKMGKEKFLDYLSRFGFFEKTNIDLPEIYSQNKNLKKGYEVNLATASFGQGIELTSVQLIKAYLALINEGKMLRVHAVKKIINGENEKEFFSEIEREVISPKTSRQISEMLLSVIENGYSKKAKIEGYLIGGKTGTAQVAFSSLGISKPGYSDKTIQSFIGFFPVFDPQFLIFVKLHNPKTKTAEYSALLIFKEIVRYLISHFQVPPNY